jgi:hypothetical protein
MRRVAMFFIMLVWMRGASTKEGAVSLKGTRKIKLKGAELAIVGGRFLLRY